MVNERVKVQTLRKKISGSGNEKRKRLTQKAIVDTAAELFARDGFGATSLDDIAAMLGVTQRGTLLSCQKQGRDSAPHLSDCAYC